MKSYNLKVNEKELAMLYEALQVKKSALRRERNNVSSNDSCINKEGAIEVLDNSINEYQILKHKMFVKLTK